MDDQCASDNRRALAFQAFFHRFVTPPVQLTRVIRDCKIHPWFRAETLEEAGGTSWSPVHGRQWERRGLYRLRLPEAGSPGQTLTAVLNAFSRPTDFEELLRRIKKADVPPGLVIVRIHVGEY